MIVPGPGKGSVGEWASSQSASWPAEAARLRRREARSDGN